MQLTYGRLQAFTLFLEEGYLQRPGNPELPRAFSEVLGLVYVILAPFRRGDHRG